MTTRVLDLLEKLRADKSPTIRRDAIELLAVKAEQKLDALLPDASDGEIASALAEYYVSKRWMMHGTKIRLSILSDSPTPKGSLKFAHKYNPVLHAQMVQDNEACQRQLSLINRLGFDWQRKNVYGITTDDDERARDWAVAAMLAGFAVFYAFNQHSGGGSKGTIADWRKRQADILKTGRGERRPDLYDLEWGEPR
jgi:hypothetical protein